MANTHESTCICRKVGNSYDCEYDHNKLKVFKDQKEDGPSVSYNFGDLTCKTETFVVRFAIGCYDANDRCGWGEWKDTNYDTYCNIPSSVPNGQRACKKGEAWGGRCASLDTLWATNNVMHYCEDSGQGTIEPGWWGEVCYYQETFSAGNWKHIGAGVTFDYSGLSGDEDDPDDDDDDPLVATNYKDESGFDVDVLVNSHDATGEEVKVCCGLYDDSPIEDNLAYYSGGSSGVVEECKIETELAKSPLMSTVSITVPTMDVEPGPYKFACALRETPASGWERNSKPGTAHPGDKIEASGCGSTFLYEKISNSIDDVMICRRDGELNTGGQCCEGHERYDVSDQNTGCCSQASNCWDNDKKDCVPQGTLKGSRVAVCIGGGWKRCNANRAGNRISDYVSSPPTNAICTSLYSGGTFVYYWTDLNRAGFFGESCGGDCYLRESSVFDPGSPKPGCGSTIPFSGAGSYSSAGCGSGICAGDYCLWAASKDDCTDFYSGDAIDSVAVTSAGTLRGVSDGIIDSCDSDELDDDDRDLDGDLSDNLGQMCDDEGGLANLARAEEIVYSDGSCDPAVKTTTVTIDNRQRSFWQINGGPASDVSFGIATVGEDTISLGGMYLFCASPAGDINLIEVSQSTDSYGSGTTPFSKTMSLDDFPFPGGLLSCTSSADCQSDTNRFTWYCAPSVTKDKETLSAGDALYPFGGSRYLTEGQVRFREDDIVEEMYVLSKSGASFWDYVTEADKENIGVGRRTEWSHSAFEVFVGPEDSESHFFEVYMDDIDLGLSLPTGVSCRLPRDDPKGDVLVDGDNCAFTPMSPEHLGTVKTGFLISPRPYNPDSVAAKTYRLSCKAYSGPDLDGEELNDGNIFLDDEAGLFEISHGKASFSPGASMAVGFDDFNVVAHLPKFRDYLGNPGICGASDGLRAPYSSCDYSIECEVELVDENGDTMMSRTIAVTDQSAHDVGTDFQKRPLGPCVDEGINTDVYCMSLLCERGTCAPKSGACNFGVPCSSDDGCLGEGFCEEDKYEDISTRYFCPQGTCEGICMDGTTTSGYCHLGCVRGGRESDSEERNFYCAGNLPVSSPSPGCDSLCMFECEDDPFASCDLQVGENHSMEFGYGSILVYDPEQELRELACDYEDTGCPVSVPCIDCCDLECDLLARYPNEDYGDEPERSARYYPIDGIGETSYLCGVPKKKIGVPDYDICSPGCIGENVQQKRFQGGSYTLLENFFGDGIDGSGYPMNYPFLKSPVEPQMGTVVQECIGEVAGGPVCTEWCYPRETLIDNWRIDTVKEGDVSLFWGSSPEEAMAFCQDPTNWLELLEAQELLEDDEMTYQTHRLSFGSDGMESSAPAIGFSSCGLIDENELYLQPEGDDLSYDPLKLQEENNGAAAYVMGFVLPFNPHCPGELRLDDEGNVIDACSVTATSEDPDACVSLPFAQFDDTFEPDSGVSEIPFLDSDVTKISNLELGRDASQQYMGGEGSAPRDLWIVCSSLGRPIMFVPRYVPSGSGCAMGQDNTYTLDFEFDAFGKRKGEDVHDVPYSFTGMSADYRATYGREDTDAKREMLDKECATDQPMCAEDSEASPCGCATNNFCYSHFDCYYGKGCVPTPFDEETSPWLCTPSHRCAYEGDFGKIIQVSVFNYDETMHDADDYANEPWQCRGPTYEGPEGPQACAPGDAATRVAELDGTLEEGRIKPCDLINVVGRINSEELESMGCTSLDDLETLTIGGMEYGNLVANTKSEKDYDEQVEPISRVYIYGSESGGRVSKLWVPVGVTKNREVVELKLTCKDANGVEHAFVDHFSYKVGTADGHTIHACPNWEPTARDDWDDWYQWEYGSYCSEDAECSSTYGVQVCWEREEIKDNTIAPHLYPPPETATIKQCMFRCGENPGEIAECDPRREDFLVCEECCNEDGTAAGHTIPGDTGSEALDWAFMKERYSERDPDLFDNAQEICWKECKGEDIIDFGYSCDRKKKGSEMCSEECEPTCGDGDCQPEFGEVVYVPATDSYDVKCPLDCCDFSNGQSVTFDSGKLEVDNEYIVGYERAGEEGLNYFVLGREDGTVVEDRPSMPFTTTSQGVCWSVCNNRENPCDAIFPELPENSGRPYSTSPCTPLCTNKRRDLTIEFFDPENCMRWENGLAPDEDIQPCTSYTVGIAAEYPLECRDPDGDNCTLSFTGTNQIIEYTIDYLSFPPGTNDPDSDFFQANYICNGLVDGERVPITYRFSSASEEGAAYDWYLSVEDEATGLVQDRSASFSVKGGPGGTFCGEDANCRVNADCDDDLYCNRFLDEPVCKPVCNEEEERWLQCGLIESPDYCEEEGVGPTVGVCEPQYRETIRNDCSDNLRDIGQFSGEKIGDCCDATGQASIGSPYAGLCKVECGAESACDDREPGYASVDKVTGYVEYICSDNCEKVTERMDVNLQITTETGLTVVDTSSDEGYRCNSDEDCSGGFFCDLAMDRPVCRPTEWEMEQAIGKRMIIKPEVYTRADPTGAEITILANGEKLVEDSWEDGNTYSFDTMSEVFQKGENKISVVVDHPRIIWGEKNITMRLYRNMLLDAKVLSGEGASVDCVYRTGSPRKGCEAGKVFVDVSLEDLSTGDVLIDREALADGQSLEEAGLSCTLDGSESSLTNNGLIRLDIPTGMEVGLKSLACTATRDGYQDAHKSSSVRVLGVTRSVSVDSPESISPGETYDLSVKRVVDEEGEQVYNYDWYWSVGSRRFCYNVKDCEVPSDISSGEQEVELTVFANYYEPYVQKFNATIMPRREYQVSLNPSSKYVSQRGGRVAFSVELENSGNERVDLSFAVASGLEDLSGLEKADEGLNDTMGEEEFRGVVRSSWDELAPETRTGIQEEIGMAGATEEEAFARVYDLLVAEELECTATGQDRSETCLLMEGVDYKLRDRPSSLELFAESISDSRVSDWASVASPVIFADPSETATNFIYFDVPPGELVGDYDFTVLYQEELVGAQGKVQTLLGTLRITDKKIYEFELRPEEIPGKSIVFGSDESFNLTLVNTGTMEDEYGFRVAGSGARYVETPLVLEVPVTGSGSAGVPITIDGRERGRYDYQVCAQSANNITGEHCSSGEFSVSVADLAIMAPQRIDANMSQTVNFTVTVATGDIPTAVDVSFDAPSIIQQKLSVTEKNVDLEANSEESFDVSFIATNEGNFTIHIRATSSKMPTLVKSADIKVGVFPSPRVQSFRRDYQIARQKLNDLNQLVERAGETGVDIVLARQLASDASDLMDEAEALIAAGRYAEAESRMEEAEEMINEAEGYAEVPAVEKKAAGGISLPVGVLAIVAVLVVLGGIAYAFSQGMLPGM